MSELVVITFASEEAGPEALKRVHDLRDAGSLDVQDSAVIMKDPDGKTHVANTVSSGTKSGALVGGMLGLLFGLFFLPLFGIMAGAAAGIAFARGMSMHVDKGFVEDVTNELTPGTSALFVILAGNVGALTTAVSPFKGKVFQTTLDPELEESLNQALATGR
jgi:uncharacterized membrane protein